MFAHDNLNMVQYLCEITRGANTFQTPEDLRKYVTEHTWDENKVTKTLQLPHSKLGRFTDITFLISGTSRRFLSQITTHHVGISFMSGSLQYSNWSKKKLEDMFCTPYEVLSNGADVKQKYLDSCSDSMKMYDTLSNTIGNDAAGYLTPQALRNIMVIKVNLEELRFIGRQRLCRRNTGETAYVVGLMCMLVEKEFNLPTNYFMPLCFKDKCTEYMYSCKQPLSQYLNIKEYLKDTFKLLDI